MKKDTLYSVKSRYGVETFVKHGLIITKDDIAKYQRDGFTVYVKCGKCNDKHDINVKCPVCGKETRI